MSAWEQTMSGANEMPMVKITPAGKTLSVLGLGCWSYGGSQWGGQDDDASMGAMGASLRCGINHFDTAVGYGGGRSETVVGEFLAGRRDDVFLASKSAPRELTRDEAIRQVEGSLARLGTDVIDLYYIHWPRKGKDMRGVMEGLEDARRQGKIRAIGVSNFSVEQMAQVAEVGRIDAHQLCYSLCWRFAEAEIMPYCAANGIAVVTYSTIAQGILTGKFPREVKFPEGDDRARMVLFDEAVWPHVYDGVERLKEVAAEAGRPLSHLAIRWAAEQDGVS